MRKQNTAGMFGGTRPTPDGFDPNKVVEPPPLIDPADVLNCPACCEPFADARLFGGDMATALAHKHRPYLDPEGRVWVSNVTADPDAVSPVLLAACEGLRVGEPRPTTAVDGSVEKLKAAGVAGLYRPLPSDARELYEIATGGL